MTSIEIPSNNIRPRSTSKPPRRKETKTGGIEIGRFFTKPGVDVYDTCEWEMRSAAITSETGGIVFEPFSGSGTTLIACEQTGRACRAIELEARYVQVAIERWEALTGKKAERVPVEEDWGNG